jgi:hypothetical protein
LVVEKIGIYRKGNDIKMGVIPRHEESPAVLFMFNLSFPEPREMLLYVQHDGCSENLSMVVEKIGIYRIENDIKLPVIPSGENWHLQKGE